MNVANLDLARSALGKQTSNGVLLNLQPSHLIVPKALEGTARTIVNAQYNDGSVKVIGSAYLDLVSNTAWYLLSATNPPLSVATLQSYSIPQLSSKVNIRDDTIDFKTVFDFAVVASEYRSIVKSTGV